MVFSHPVWIYVFSQSFASNSETHHRFLAPILPFDLIFFIRSFMISILYCCFISSSSVDPSSLLCKCCKLYSLNEEKILAQQYFLPLSFFCISCFCVLSSIRRGHLLLSCSLRLCTCPGLTLPFFQPTSSSMSPSRSGSDFISSVDHPGTSFLSFGFSFYFVTFVHVPPAQVLFARHPLFKEFPSILKCCFPPHCFAIW